MRHEVRDQNKQQTSNKKGVSIAAVDLNTVARLTQFPERRVSGETVSEVSNVTCSDAMDLDTSTRLTQVPKWRVSGETVNEVNNITCANAFDVLEEYNSEEGEVMEVIRVDQEPSGKFQPQLPLKISDDARLVGQQWHKMLGRRFSSDSLLAMKGIDDVQLFADFKAPKGDSGSKKKKKHKQKKKSASKNKKASTKVSMHNTRSVAAKATENVLSSTIVSK